MKDDRLYLGIDIERIWVILQSDLPTLKQAVTKLMAP